MEEWPQELARTSLLPLDWPCPGLEPHLARLHRTRGQLGGGGGGGILPGGSMSLFLS